jgi:hypothetical protein
MGNEIVAVRSSASMDFSEMQTVSAQAGPPVYRCLTESARALLREELDRAGSLATRRADHELAARLHDIFGLLLMARRLAEVSRHCPEQREKHPV